MKFDPDEMRARFHELKGKHDAILAKAAPLQAELSAKWEIMSRADENKLREKIKKARAGLYEIDNEMAMISRALNGKTGLPKAAGA